jgi:hypothetical protein
MAELQLPSSLKNAVPLVMDYGPGHFMGLCPHTTGAAGNEKAGYCGRNARRFRLPFFSRAAA